MTASRSISEPPAAPWTGPVSAPRRGPRLDPELLAGRGGPGWTTLGDWGSARGYVEAAEALAERLGRAAALAPGQRVLDVGVGRGEQIAFWHRRFGVTRVSGLEPCAEAVAAARRRLRAVGLSGAGFEVRVGDHRLGGFAPNSVERVVALDCAYHFAPRRAFFAAARRVLVDGGRLALTDLTLRSGSGAGAECRLAPRLGIPRSNLVDEATYRRELADAGFDAVEIDDRTDAVLGGFARWVGRRWLGLLVRGVGRGGPAVVATAIAARWALARGRVRYRVVSARAG